MDVEGLSLWFKLLPRSFIINILHRYQQIMPNFLWKGAHDLQFYGGVTTDAEL